MKYTLIVFSENTPGVLYRIADLFLKRKINVDSLTVSETQRHDTSRFTIVIESEPEKIEKVAKQLYRIVEVIKVYENTEQDVIAREIALLKVVTDKPEKRHQVENLAKLLQAKIVTVGTDYLIIEKSGSEEEISSLLLLMKPFGIREFVRSGRIAVMKKEEKTQKKGILPAPHASQVAAAIDVSMIKKIELMARNKQGAISLAQGIPSFATPDHIKKAAIEAVEKGLGDKYTAGYGIAPLREAIVKKVAKDNGITADVSQVIVTHGAIEGLMATFMAILDPGDELVILTPDYASHITQARIASLGAHPIAVPLKESDAGWTLDVDKLEASITSRTKALLLCNPCNPSGKVYTKEELKEIARVALQHNLFIVTDETYEYFVFDKKEHISIGSFEEVADRVISIFSVSKSYAMTGWRIGYIVASTAVSKEIFKVHDSLITCPTGVSQYAALAALVGPKKDVQHFKKEFLKRRQLVIDKLGNLDTMNLVIPEGAYYAFPKVLLPIDDYDLAIQLLENAKVAVIPGSPFGLGGEGHLRISFGAEEKVLEEGLERMVKYLKQFRR